MDELAHGFSVFAFGFGFLFLFQGFLLFFGEFGFAVFVEFWLGFGFLGILDGFLLGFFEHIRLKEIV